MRTLHKTVNVWVTVLVAATLALAGIFASPASAQATGTSGLAINDAEAAVSSSKLSLDEAKAKLDAISAEYSALNSEIDEMQSEIDDLAKRVLEAQEAMLDGRDALSATAVYEYRNDTVTTMLNVLLGSQNISELTTNMNYLSQIMDYQAEEIATQKKLRDELEETSAELTAQKEEQDAKLSELDRKKSEAQSIVNQVSQQYAANTEYLAALKATADAMNRSEKPAAQIDPGANTINRPSNSGGTGGDAGGSSGGGTDTSGEGWRTGRATAYGGSSDPGTPNPGRTATGAVCNDYSVGVAVPTAWSNYRSYFGRTVQIVYNGKTVYAPVNDCGGMRGGYISLDLQPGVFKAFGFNTCQAWGVRTVQYRFL